jgi:hypothetical protein
MTFDKKSFCESTFYLSVVENIHLFFLSSLKILQQVYFSKDPEILSEGSSKILTDAPGRVLEILFKGSFQLNY